MFASPVGAAGRVYITGRDGTTLVLRHGPTYEVLAKNTLDDGFDASPALVDNEIYLRGYRYLVLHQRTVRDRRRSTCRATLETAERILLCAL